MNNVVKFSVGKPVASKIPLINLDSLRVVGFSDASFLNNHDLSTQLGCIVFLGDRHGNSFENAFNSYTSKLIVRSALTSEVIACQR